MKTEAHIKLKTFLCSEIPDPKGIESVFRATVGRTKRRVDLTELVEANMPAGKIKIKEQSKNAEEFQKLIERETKQS